MSKAKAFTRLTEKAHSPLVIRKVTRFGFPIYVGIITDDDLDSLDRAVVGFIKSNLDRWKSDSLQDKRNLAGELVDVLVETFGKLEGVAVVFYIDKTCISSLFGDFMNHAMCRQEFYTLLVMGTGV